MCFGILHNVCVKGKIRLCRCYGFSKDFPLSFFLCLFVLIHVNFIVASDRMGRTSKCCGIIISCYFYIIMYIQDFYIDNDD